MAHTQAASSLPEKIQQPPEEESPYSLGDDTAARTMGLGSRPEGFLDDGSAPAQERRGATCVSADRGEHHAWWRRK